MSADGRRAEHKRDVSADGWRAEQKRDVSADGWRAEHKRDVSADGRVAEFIVNQKCRKQRDYRYRNPITHNCGYFLYGGYRKAGTDRERRKC